MKHSSNSEAFLVAVAGLISLHGCAATKGRELGLSTHQLRVLLAIHWLCSKRFRVTRKTVEKNTYLWLSSINPTIELLIGKGLIEPLVEPRYYLHLTSEGLSLISSIEMDFRKRWKLMLEGPKVPNKAKRKS